MKNIFSGLFRSDETITEKQVERNFVKAVKEAGGLAMKFVSPGRVGVPDRIVLLPGGRAVFAEIKRPGGRDPIGCRYPHVLWAFLRCVGNLYRALISNMRFSGSSTPRL